MEVKTYPEMNGRIKEILKVDKANPVDAYALARIEELEKENREMKYYIKQSVELGCLIDPEEIYKKYI